MMNTNTQGAQTTAIKGVQVQTSTFGTAQPIVYGTHRVTCNLLSYGNFNASTSSGGGK